MRNFPLHRPGQSVPASATAGAPATLLLTAPGEDAGDVMIYNPGPGVVHVRAGASTVTADATCMPIVAGEKGAWSKGGSTHLAAYSPSGAQSLIVIVGSGS